MRKENHDKYLSKTERERFDALANWNTVKAAALSLGLDPGTLYNWRLQIKKKYRKNRGWINAVLAQTKRGKLLKNLLHEKRKMAPPDSENPDGDEIGKEEFVEDEFED